MKLSFVAFLALTHVATSTAQGTSLRGSESCSELNDICIDNGDGTFTYDLVRNTRYKEHLRKGGYVPADLVDGKVLDLDCRLNDVATRRLQSREICVDNEDGTFSYSLVRNRAYRNHVRAGGSVPGDTVNGLVLDDDCNFITDPPTKAPSPQPTTPSPTTSPTPQPTTPNPTKQSPTRSPTLSPTMSPTKQPSRSPTMSPSASPSSGPTGAPTLSPTKFPSASPSAGPTGAPSSSPSGGPTSAPSSTPTAAPSSTPSGEPSSAPSAGPTGAPSSAPSAGPTGGPSSAPSSSPSEQPTLAPTRSPTKAPTLPPTYETCVFSAVVTESTDLFGSLTYNFAFDNLLPAESEAMLIRECQDGTQLIRPLGFDASWFNSVVIGNMGGSASFGLNMGGNNDPTYSPPCPVEEAVGYFTYQCVAP